MPSGNHMSRLSTYCFFACEGCDREQATAATFLKALFYKGFEKASSTKADFFSTYYQFKETGDKIYSFRLSGASVLTMGGCFYHLPKSCPKRLEKGKDFPFDLSPSPKTTLPPGISRK
jgi:hypothetical protein